MIAVLVSLTACEKDPILKPEETEPSESHLVAAIVISYDQTTITTSPQGTSPTESSAGEMSLSATGTRTEVLRHFERTRRKMRIHDNGRASLEVEYLEGNSDINIPMELYQRIKHRLHPPDPARKPITRFTIINDRYTGYAADGSVVFSKQFPQLPVNPSAGLLKAAAMDPGIKNATAIKEQLERSGAQIRAMNNKEVVVERTITNPASPIGLKKEVVNLESGQIVHSVSYDRSGRPMLAERIKHEVVNDLPIPSVVVTHRYGESPSGTWVVRETTIEQRTKISVERY